MTKLKSCTITAITVFPYGNDTLAETCIQPQREYTVCIIKKDKVGGWGIYLLTDRAPHLNRAVSL